ncbi:MAG TPA: biopolymer transporter ExbD [Kofleriaceae bacterium]|nr:biopolymer transporter ExbD [Kofleriaceae bacterium]
MRVIAVAAMLAVGFGCGRKATNAATEGSSTTADGTTEPGTEDRPLAQRRARAEACLGYQLDYWKQAATERAIGKAPAPPDLTRYACASLYREPPCGQAWPVDADSSDPARDARRIARACATAYCPSLDASRLALCGDAEVSDTDLIAALVALDTQILGHELGDPTRAAQLAARHRLFRDQAHGPTASAPTLVVTLTANGTIILGHQIIDRADLGPRLTAARAANPDLALAIAADASLPYSDVVSIMDVAKQAGIKKLSLQTSK